MQNFSFHVFRFTHLDDNFPFHDNKDAIRPPRDQFIYG